MGIRVECPHGHVFKVKDKYAGKKGLCPKCTGQVQVHVPALMSSEQAQADYRRLVNEESQASKMSPADSAASVLDDSVDENGSSSGSLLGSSVIRHHVKCKCGQAVPMWFAKCPGCGNFMER